MSDDSSSPLTASSNAAAGHGAGQLMRAERERQGMHIAALAAAMKVPQAKLEALEADRLGDLPDATFARALAQSVCRSLKIDPAPVLARLPATRPVTLERVADGLNMPFRERPNRTDPVDWIPWRQPLFWAVVGLLVGAGLLVVWPQGWLQGVARSGLLPSSGQAAQPVADKSSPLPPELVASAMAGTSVERIELPAATIASAVTGAAVAVSPTGTRVRAIEQTWVQVTDAAGVVVFARLLTAGELIDLDAQAAARIRLGNARGSELTWRGQVVDLASSTRDNVATVELR